MKRGDCWNGPFAASNLELLFKEGTVVAQARVFGGDQRYVPLVGNGAIRLLSPRGVGDKFVVRAQYTGPLPAPIKKGAEVARLRVLRGNSTALEVPLFAGVDVGVGSLTQRAYDSTSELASSLVRSGISSVLKR